MTCMQQIKNWQLDLQFDPSFDRQRVAGRCNYGHATSALGRDMYYIRVSILALSVALVKHGSTELQTLKIRVPYLCNISGHSSLEEACEAIAFTIEPLRQLLVKGTVTFFAATQTLSIEPYNIATTKEQCPEADCLALANSFGRFTSRLRNTEYPRYSLDSFQKTWLDFKERYTAHHRTARRSHNLFVSSWSSMETQGYGWCCYINLRKELINLHPDFWDWTSVTPAMEQDVRALMENTYKLSFWEYWKADDDGGAWYPRRFTQPHECPPPKDRLFEPPA
ncbi:MAG: hypothetical protein Q9218_006818 [Villophora microphyllina]